MWFASASRRNVPTENEIAMSRLWIDHVIYAVDDLDAAGAALFDREGLASVPGGRHEGWGTANRIVPLGESYLELIAVVDVEEAEQSEFGRAVRRALTEDQPLVGWVVATDDIDAVAGRLDLEVEEKSREAADGSTLELAARRPRAGDGERRAAVLRAVGGAARAAPGRRGRAPRGGRARDRVGRGEHRRRGRAARVAGRRRRPPAFGSPTAIPALPPPRSRRAAPRS